MKVVTDHGWPKASNSDDDNALDAFKNERDYIAQNGRFKTTVAAMDWAFREIERLRSMSDAISITLLPREDGGLRVYSTTEPGLILSGADPVKVMADVWPALNVLREYRRTDGQLEK